MCDQNSVSVISPKRSFKVRLYLFYVYILWINDTFRQDPVTVFLRLFLHLCVFGVFICLEDDLLLTVVERRTFV